MLFLLCLLATIGVAFGGNLLFMGWQLGKIIETELPDNITQCTCGARVSRWLRFPLRIGGVSVGIWVEKHE